MARPTRYATLVGCLYKRSQCELSGCINDVKKMRTMLIDRFGFEQEHIVTLTDDTPTKATQENIMNALNNMISKAVANDVLFFFFSGYGAWPGHEQALVPLDIRPLITRTDFQGLVNNVPEGASFTILFDSGHSGGLINNNSNQSRFSDVGPNPTVEDNRHPNRISKTLPENMLLSLPGFQPTTTASGDGSGDINGILLGACQENETAIEVVPAKDPPYGVFTKAILEVLSGNKNPISNKDLLKHVKEWLQGEHFGQNPGLYCSNEEADAYFLRQG